MAINQKTAFMHTDSESSLLGRRIAIMLHLLKNGESTANSMIDAGAVDMQGISLTRILKQLALEGFINVRGGIKQTHYYEINPNFAQIIADCISSYKAAEGAAK